MLLFIIVIIDTANDDDVIHLPYGLPLNEIWNMTVDEIIDQNNLLKDAGENPNKVAIVSHISYLSKMYGNQTFETITKNFINQYSSVLHNQLLYNRKMEQAKSKLLTDFMSCQLLIQIESSDFKHIAELIKTIRK